MQAYRRVRRLAAAVLAVTAIAACSSGSSHAAQARPEKPNLVVAAVPSEGAAGLYIAQAQGLFAQVGLHVTIRNSTSSQAVLPDLINGSVDVASGQYTSYIVADATKKVKMRILAAGLSLGPRVQEVLTGPNSKIQNLGGLKGKRIAVNVISGITADLLDSALAAYGVAPNQVHLIQVPFPDMASWLAAGRVDAIFEVEPYVTEVTLSYGCQVLADIDSGATKDFPIAGYGVLASWAARYPRTAAAFAKAISEANAIAATNLAVFQHSMAVQLRLSPEVADVMATGIFPTTVDAVQLQRVADLMLYYGQLKHAFRVQKILGP